MPIELRWEAVEELEAMVQKVGLSGRTDGMALVAHRGLRILRVGKGGQRVEAWWRYGRQFRTRRLLRSPLIVGGMLLTTTAAMLVGGINGITTTIGYVGGAMWPMALELTRVFGFNRLAWRGSMTCRKCGGTRASLRLDEFRRLEMVPGARSGEVALRVPCLKCDRWSLRLDRMTAQHVMQRSLAYHHFFGAPRDRVQEAMELIENAGSAREYLVTLAKERRRFRDYSRSEMVAVEMAVADAAEARLSAMSLDEQRTVWEEEEELARIIDHELTPLRASA